MASPYATLAGVPRGDVANMERVFVDHCTRHQCPKVSGCELRKDLKDALDHTKEAPRHKTRPTGRLPNRVVDNSPSAVRACQPRARQER
jgi:hypothetical protein